MRDLTILLVDDEIEFVTTLAERLQLRGFQVDIAIDGNDALQRFSNSDYDIVVLDILMPGMSGFDVIKEMKKIKFDTPVILLTGHGATKEGMEGMSLGAFDYLMKPIDIDELIQKFESAVAKKI